MTYDLDMSGVNVDAEINRRADFVATGSVGDRMERVPVFICSTDRVFYDKPARVEFLTAVLGRNGSGLPAIAYLCPCYPLGGIIPGAQVGGLPMLARDCMRPFSRQRRMIR